LNAFQRENLKHQNIVHTTGTFSLFVIGYVSTMIVLYEYVFVRSVDVPW